MASGGSSFKWVDMEQLLRCPVCLEIPDPKSGTPIEQCAQGHHICASCRARLLYCPLCRHPYDGTRNFVLEELALHQKDIKEAFVKSETKKKPAAGPSSNKALRFRFKIRYFLRKVPIPGRCRNCKAKKYKKMMYKIVYKIPY